MCNKVSSFFLIHFLSVLYKWLSKYFHSFYNKLFLIMYYLVKINLLWYNCSYCRLSQFFPQQNLSSSGRIIFHLFSVSESYQRVDWLYQQPLSDTTNFFFHLLVKVLNFFLFGALFFLLQKGFLFLSIFNFNKKVYTITFVKFMNIYYFWDFY